MKKGMIIASFGTTYKDTRLSCIESVEERFRQAFPDYEVRRAFTSNIIIRKLKEADGEIVHTPQQAIQQMMEEGFEAIHVQPLHVIPGFEYEKVQRAVRLANHKSSFPISLGHPLLYHEADYDQVVKAIEKQLPLQEKNHGVVLMGHGTEHNANASYSMLQAKISESRQDVHIANVEGYPELEQILNKLNQYAAVTLMPLMLVAGDHARNDMAGEEDSYCTILREKGIEVNPVLKGLGENPQIQLAFVERAREILKEDSFREGKLWT